MKIDWKDGKKVESELPKIVKKTELVRPETGAAKKRAPPQWLDSAATYHPLEKEARRALNITKRMGQRLNYQLNKLSVSEDEAGQPRGSAGLPDILWAEQYGVYLRGLVSLIREQRKFYQLNKLQVKNNIELDESEESDELINAVELLTDDELKIALSRREVKNGSR